uniref:Uncharacterized protein n=1 Tax=Steinernema glaseri TaxID=37863 RepID=A0A1I7YY88_9BILA
MMSSGSRQPSQGVYSVGAQPDHELGEPLRRWRADSTCLAVTRPPETSMLPYVNNAAMSLLKGGETLSAGMQQTLKVQVDYRFTTHSLTMVVKEFC